MSVEATDLVEADFWAQMVLSDDTPLSTCEDRFRKFSLRADEKLLETLNEAFVFRRQNKISTLKLRDQIALLEKIIEEKKTLA